jgi:hypothetical protein
MAKYKRQTRKHSASITTEAKAAGPTSGSGAGGSTSGFNPDYSYVVKDLRRIGVLAGTFIVVLVAISFFLR